MGEHMTDYARTRKPLEEIRPCVCVAKAFGGNQSSTFGMPALIPHRMEPEYFTRVYWTITCPRCGRGGVTEHKSVNAALESWNKMQDELWRGPEAFDLPWAYPIGQEDVYEPLYARYRELIREIGYGYLLELPPDEKEPLMRDMGLKEKVDALEAVLKTKLELREERRRMYAEIEGVPEFGAGVEE